MEESPSRQEVYENYVSTKGESPNGIGEIFLPGSVVNQYKNLRPVSAQLTPHISTTVADQDSTSIYNQVKFPILNDWMTISNDDHKTQLKEKFQTLKFTWKFF